ncbi:MAG: LptF/LptG family permease [Phyllobacteriaceae bacterium]|nr:LptF/LptG family permease [Phyllobacteriaceae bacterium]
MKLYERYLFKRVLVATLATLGFAVLVMATIQALDHVELLIGSRTGFALFVAMLMTLLPAALVLLSPLAVLIGVMVVAGAANRDGETTVMGASGFSASPGAVPALAVGALASLVCLGFSLGVEPWANQRGRAILAEAAADVVRLSNHPGEFRSIEDRLFVRVGARIDESRFADVLIIDQRDPAKETIYTAQSLAIAEADGRSVIAMQGSTIQTKSPKDAAPAIFHLSEFLLDVSNLLENKVATRENPREWSTLRLAAQAAALASGANPETRVEINRRFSDWLYPLAFAAVAALFSSRPASGRGAQPNVLALALIAALILRFAGFSFLGGSGGSMVRTVLTYMSPIAVIVAAFAHVMRGRLPFQPIAPVRP